jgi:hypothetical protein
MARGTNSLTERRAHVIAHVTHVVVAMWGEER